MWGQLLYLDTLPFLRKSVIRSFFKELTVTCFQHWTQGRIESQHKGPKMSLLVTKYSKTMLTRNQTEKRKTPLTWSFLYLGDGSSNIPLTWDGEHEWQLALISTFQFLLQLTKKLSLLACFQSDPRIFYNPDHPREGGGKVIRFWIIVMIPEMLEFETRLRCQFASWVSTLDTHGLPLCKLHDIHINTK